MLTVKHVEGDGHETIDTAESVSFFPATFKDGLETRPATLTAFGGSCRTSGENHSTYGNGMVYVVNDGGKTVGKYDLEIRDPNGS